MDTSEQTPPKKPQRFFDIVPANQTKPNTSSRPIVTNQPVQDDPMMKAKDTSEPSTKPKAQSVSEPSQITVAEALDSASEPIKLDTPSEAESAQPVEAEDKEPEPDPESNTEADTITKADEEPVKDDPSIVVSRSGRMHPIRDAVILLLILVLIVVIVDLLLDLNIVKLSLPHTHYFGG